MESGLIVCYGSGKLLKRGGSGDPLSVSERAWLPSQPVFLSVLPQKASMSDCIELLKELSYGLSVLE